MFEMGVNFVELHDGNDLVKMTDSDEIKKFENVKIKNIVLCGSMKVKDKIVEVEQMLKEKGYNVLLPRECMAGLPKVIASRAHFSRIVDPENDTILIVNATKNGIENYIGPNSFAEIAFSLFYNKNIFVLNEFYDLYLDELEGWGVKELHGDLENLKGEQVLSKNLNVKALKK